MVYLTIIEFDGDIPILYGQNKYTAPFGVQMSGEDVSGDSKGYKKVPAGMFIVNVGNKARFLPRTTLKEATATNSALVSLKSPCFQFLTGDVLYAVSSYAQVTFAGTFAEGNLYSIKLGDTNYSVTAPATPNANNVAAAFVTANSADLAELDITVRQVGSTGTIEILATDSLKIDTYSNNGAVQLTVNTTEPGYLGDSIIALGTISAIGAANNAGERVITLGANASMVLPAGTPVGVRVGKYLGIYPIHLDLIDEPQKHIAPITGCDGVYERNLPYCDAQIKRALHQLNINKVFYKNV